MMLLPAMRRGLLGGAGNSLVPAGAAAAAALALLPAPPSTATRNKLVTAINALSAGGWWSKMDFFHFYAADNTPNSVIDLTGNGFVASPLHAMTFLPRTGYFGDATAAFISIAGYVPSVNGVKYTLNSASLCIGIVNNRTTPQAWVGIGDTNASSVFDQIAPLFTGSVGIGSVTASAGSVSGAATTAKGTWVVSRTNSTTVTLYQNAAVIGSSTSNASASMTTNPMVVGARWINNTQLGNFSGDTIAFDFAGSGFSQSDVTGITAALAPLIASTMPASVAAAWGFTSTKLAYTPTGLSDIDTGLTNGPGFNLYMTPFWGVGAPSGSDLSYAGGVLTNLTSVNAEFYRSRVSTRGNSSSTFQGSISGNVLTVSAQLGVVPGSTGGTGFTNPVAVGQIVAGAGMGLTQPLQGPTIIQQLSGTTGGVETYQLSASFGTIASQVFNGYSTVGAIAPFKPGGFFEFNVAFNPAQSQAAGFAGGYPLMQMVGLNSLLGRQFVNTAHSSQMSSTEFDFLEVFPNGSGGSPQLLLTLHDEIVPSFYADWNFTGNQNHDATSALSGTTFTSPQKFQILWVPSFLNGGVGLIQRFFNGVHLDGFDVTYSASALATPTASWGGGTNANFVGNMFAAESDQMVLQFDGGFGQALNLSGITVTQTP